MVGIKYSVRSFILCELQAADPSKDFKSFNPPSMLSAPLQTRAESTGRREKLKKNSDPRRRYLRTQYHKENRNLLAMKQQDFQELPERAWSTLKTAKDLDSRG